MTMFVTPLLPVALVAWSQPQASGALGPLLLCQCLVIHYSLRSRQTPGRGNVRSSYNTAVITCLLSLLSHLK